MNGTTSHEKRVLASYWHATYPNTAARKHHLRRFLERCADEGIDMDRTIALAMSSAEMGAFAARYFAHSAAAARRQALARSIVQRHVVAALDEMRIAMPGHDVSLSSTAYQRPCVRVGAWQYALDTLLAPSAGTSKL